MSALNGLPGHALAFLFLGGIGALEADGGGIDEQVSTLQRHEPGCFGIPLVPAHEHTESAHAGVDGVEAQVAWGEVELLVVGWIVGDVHLAVDAGDVARLLDDHGCVVVEAGGTAFEE